ncbi:MAG: aminotransferase class I/II-fold pyridoxal phosphate-dependent enzyme, partial [Spirochaetales bacterium]|nr:aminotransferase class I/II-fold pyridoxal phosphate-dependent enzyme [Spirochaetales bacterium]
MSKKDNIPREYRGDTAAIRAQMKRSGHREHSQPVYLTSSFVFESAEQARDTFTGELEGQIYSRYNNPGTDEFIEKLCLLEGTEDGLSTSSGMAAIFGALASLLRSGDHIVASRSIFGSTLQIISNILPRWGISFSYVDSRDFRQWEEALRPETKMVFLETPSNPCLDIIDLEKLSELTKAKGIILAVDNTFATPVLQNPARLGADLVIHSATKFIDGQGRVLGGAILGPENLIEEARFFTRQTGPALSPFNGWVLSKSLETLSLRMDRHCSSARTVADHLESRR